MQARELSILGAPLHWSSTVPGTWALAQSRGRDKAAFEFIFSRRQKGVNQLVDDIVSDHPRDQPGR